MEVAKNKKPPTAGANRGGQIRSWTWTSEEVTQYLKELGYCKCCAEWADRDLVEHSKTEAHILNALSS